MQARVRPDDWLGVGARVEGSAVKRMKNELVPQGFCQWRDSKKKDCSDAQWMEYRYIAFMKGFESISVKLIDRSSVCSAILPPQ